MRCPVISQQYFRMVVCETTPHVCNILRVFHLHTTFLSPTCYKRKKNKHVFDLNADGAFLISFSDAHLLNERSSCMLTIIRADLARKTPQHPLVDYKRN